MSITNIDGSISAGVKSILDIGLTLEYLETIESCNRILGQTKFLPFYTRQSGYKVKLQTC
ncbi:MAG: pseudouridine-5'-phosphate glycosidase [Ignavibacteria bacterium]|nr:pseudouridine-5'-phosphate glycosidase [Ignavibacteria bacterium]